MQLTSLSYQTSFNIKEMHSDADWENVNKVVTEFASKSEALQALGSDPRIQEIFKDNCSILNKIHKLIEAKQNPKTSKYWQEHTVVVAYDTKNSMPQAIGVIQPSYEFNMKKCSQLFFLATAYWNIDSPHTQAEIYRVKGAGRSIVKLCSQMGKQFGSGGEVYLQSLDSAVDYYKDKLGFVEVLSDTPFYSNTELFLNEEAAELL